jgi:hypothetical protein
MDLRQVALLSLVIGCSASRDPIEVSRDAGADVAIESGFEVDSGSCLAANGTDDDGDGFTEAEGDCNDCDPSINPGAFDHENNRLDDDCDGVPDPKSACDDEFSLEDGDAFHAAAALGLCKRAVGKSWGVIAARWVKPDGTPSTEPRSYGLLPRFGVISSGTARDPSMAGYESVAGFRKGYVSGTPEGYPKDTPACPGVHTGAANDGAALELVLRVPTNVKSFEVSENFFTVEFPGYVCSKFNDWFVIDVSPKLAGYADGNIAFDKSGNPISVNSSLLQVCAAQTANGRAYECPLGPLSLKGTGFDEVDDPFSPAPHGATGWLVTRANVVPGSVMRVRFAVWDSADGNLDSTVLLDDFRWSAAEGAGTEPRPR